MNVQMLQQQLKRGWWLNKGLHLFITQSEIVDRSHIYTFLHPCPLDTGACLKVILLAWKSWTFSLARSFCTGGLLSLWIRKDQKRMCPCMWTVCGTVSDPMSSHYEESGWPKHLSLWVWRPQDELFSQCGHTGIFCCWTSALQFFSCLTPKWLLWPLWPRPGINNREIYSEILQIFLYHHTGLFLFSLISSWNIWLLIMLEH